MSTVYKKLVSQCVREFHSQGQVYFEDYAVGQEMPWIFNSTKVSVVHF